MLTIGSQKIFYYNKPVSMHKSFDGLSFLVEQSFSAKLLSGSFFVFLNRNRDKLKILYWDEDGLAIWYKRLEKGHFNVDKTGKTKLTRREFMMVLEGVEPRHLQKRFSSPKSV